MKYHESYNRSEWQQISDPFDENWLGSDDNCQVSLSDMKSCADGLNMECTHSDHYYKLKESIGDKEIVIHLRWNKKLGVLAMGHMSVEACVYSGDVYQVQYGGGYGATGVISNNKRLHGHCGIILTTDLNAPKKIMEAIKNKISFTLKNIL